MKAPLLAQLISVTSVIEFEEAEVNCNFMCGYFFLTLAGFGKVWTFWEEHKIGKKCSTQNFMLLSSVKFYVGDFFKLCAFLRKSKLKNWQIQDILSAT